MESGYWPLFRYDPRLAGTGEPLRLDSAAPKGDLKRFTANETRFSMLKHVAPARAAELAARRRSRCSRRYALYERLAAQAARQRRPGPGLRAHRPLPAPNPRNPVPGPS